MKDHSGHGALSFDGRTPSADMARLIDDFPRLKVAIVGDALLDGYLDGAFSGVCREGPVPVMTVHQQTYAPGGAGNTASNVAGLGAQAILLSAIGTDCEGERLCKALEARGVNTKYLIRAPGRRTVTKYRVRAASQMLLRLDQGTGDPLDPGTEHALIANVLDLFSTCDAVVVSDYGYGIVTPGLIKALGALHARLHRILIVDSRHHLAAFRSIGVTAVKPNYAEAMRLLEELDPAPAVGRIEALAGRGQSLLEMTGARLVVVTVDADGAMMFERGGSVHRARGSSRKEARATGAGDTFVSALALALAAGAATITAVEFASAAAAVVVEQDDGVACSALALRRMGADGPIGFHGYGRERTGSC
jgi:D-beta-D-heptose 7-phosphate kinase / D-beta-D-heptose 1-phosphate adenosyltransferase